MSGGKVGGIDRSMYRELSRAGTADGDMPVFAVAARLSKRPSFGSKTWSTDDLPRASDTPGEDTQSRGSGSAIAGRPVITAQPSHNMFSAPQPGAKPISIVRLPTRANTGSGIAPMPPPSSTMLAKMARAAVSSDAHIPTNAGVSASTSTSTSTNTSASAGVSTSAGTSASTGVSANTGASIGGGAGNARPCEPPVSVLSSTYGQNAGEAAQPRPNLTRRTTILDIERPSSSQYIMLRLYDGKRCVSDVMLTYLGIKATTIADVPVAEFDRIHMQARMEIIAKKAGPP